MAGLGKVVWKMLLVKRNTDINFLKIQMRFIMPAGFLLMVIAVIIQRQKINFQSIWQLITNSPFLIIFIIGLVLMCLMIVWAVVLDGSKARSNWIEEITNTAAQFLILISVAWFAYAGNYYQASPEALNIIAQPAEGIECTDNGKELVMSPGQTVCGLIFYPGAKVEYRAYAPLMEKLAERGIFCVVVKMPDNMAFFEINAATDIMSKYPEIEKWYIGGHSLGGAMASMYAAKHQDSVSGLVLLGAFCASDLSGSDLPVIYIRGSNDGINTEEKFKKYEHNLPENFEYVLIEGGCHAYYGNYGEQKGDGKAEISREDQQNVTTDAIADFVKNGSNVE